MARQQLAQSELRYPQRRGFLHKPWSAAEHALLLGDGIGFEVHILTGIGKGTRENTQRSEPQPVPDQLQHPRGIADIPPFIAEKQPVFFKHATPEECRRSEGTQRASMGMPEPRRQSLPRAHIGAIRIRHDDIAKSHIDRRMLRKKITHSRKGTRKILFITIQVGTDLTSAFAQAAIDRIVHAFVFLHTKA